MLLAAALAPPRAGAEQSRVATTPSHLMQTGESAGVAITSKGRLLLAPRLVPIGKAGPGRWPAQVFAAAVDAAGNAILATGPDGALIRVSPAGDVTKMFEAEEPLVTALLILPGGDILAATAPGGSIYRWRANSPTRLWSSTNERYVWALAQGPSGTVLAATGERGRLLSIDPDGNSKTLFDSDESHLVSILAAPGGGYWAGGSGKGLVYHIDADGHGTVVYDDDLPEAKAIASDSSGRLIVAFDAPPVSDRRPPAVRIRVAGGAAAGGIDELETRGSPALQGVIEGLPSESDDETSRNRGKLVSIAPDGTAHELWRSSSEAPFALALDVSGRPIFATGEPARLWRVESPSEVSLLVTMKEAQGTALVPLKNGDLFVATSNPAGTYALTRASSESGTYLAPPSDAGSIARWGTLSWEAEAAPGRVELFVRTGNSQEPDGTWSAWSPALTRAAGTPLTSPDGRFLQWRVRFSESGSGSLPIGSVAATYATRNRPPSIRDLRVEPASGAVSGKATLRWNVSDPDGDAVAVEIQARRVGTQAWTVATRSEPSVVKPTDPAQGNDGSSRDGKTSWETASWDEGAYDVRAVASDQPANAAGEGLDSTIDATQLVRIDRSPPELDASRSGDKGVDVAVTDAGSTVARLEVIEAGRAVFSPRAKDGVCDGTRESFHISASDAGTSLDRSLRATDAAGNAAEIAMPKP
jgi:hypothetical protein